MGCGGSSPEVETIQDEEITAVEAGEVETEEVKERLEIAEQEAVKTKAGTDTFIASALKARSEHAEDAAIMEDCCTRLQLYNRRLKNYIAIYDTQTVNEAMNGGFLGLGCNDRKLIAALCTRTKNQLQRTRKKYWELFDKNMRDEVKGEVGGGSYGRMMYFALASAEEYIADIIDHACVGFGCDETALLEVFVTHTQEQLQAGKTKWEERSDKSLVDYLAGELDGWIGNGYLHLRRLLNLLYMGERNESDEVDEELAAQQVGFIHEESEKGWFEDFDELQVIEIIGSNTTRQNYAIGQLYEKTYEVSLSKALEGKCGDRLHYALMALCLPPPDFIAMRLHDAMKAWFTNKDILTRLLGGLDGEKMMGVNEAYERKYARPLWSALKAEIGGGMLTSGDFCSAALTWLRALQEPSRGAEKFTEVEVSELSGDAPALCNTLDYLFLENESLLVFIAYLDVEVVREAVKGWGTDDSTLIRTFCTRNKRCLARINIGYREAYGEPLQMLIDSELGTKAGDWYAYLAKFLVVQAEQADSMILDLAMSGAAVDYSALVEFLCARHPRRVRAAKEKWEASHDDSLIDKLSDSLSGDMKFLALKMLKGKRDLNEEAVDESLARKQAHQLHDGAIDYIETLCENNAPQNALCAKFFEESYDQSLRRAISQEYSGPVKNALLALLQGPSEWYAAQLKAALQGSETNEKAVCRIIGALDKEEIKAVGAAFDKKYGVTLKSALQAECKGDYKRMAVAWVDLPDQLMQPDKKVEMPEPEPDSQEQELKLHEQDDGEISDDDESSLEITLVPTSALYQPKVNTWTAKYNKYKEMGKKRKSDYYLKLLLLNPPMPPGHKVLRGYVESLQEEYKNDASGDDWTGMWLETVDEADFEEAGTTKEFFTKWFDVTESMVAEKQVSISELMGHWGLNEAPPSPPDEAAYPEPVPLAQYGMPIGEAVPPAYGSNYPQAIPQAYPQAVPVAMPVMAAPPIYGGPMPGMYGQTTTTTTTTMQQMGGMGMPMMQQPMMGFGQPSGMYTQMPQMQMGGYPQAGYPQPGGYPPGPPGYPQPYM